MMRLPIFCRSLLFFALMAALLAAAVSAAPPIEIESDRMESAEQENAIVFRGQVVARQGDLVIHSDVMTIIYFSEDEKARLSPGDERRLKQLYAEGDVKIETADWIGTGEFMEYFELERKVNLTGNARVWQDNNLVTGDVVTLFLDEGRSIVESGAQPGERVRAFFYSNGAEGASGPAEFPAPDPADSPPDQPADSPAMPPAAPPADAADPGPPEPAGEQPEPPPGPETP